MISSRVDKAHMQAGRQAGKQHFFVDVDDEKIPGTSECQWA